MPLTPVLRFWVIGYKTVFNNINAVTMCVKVVSSTKNSAKQWFKKSGKLLINRRNRVVPKIDPWGTPEDTFTNLDRPPSFAIAS